MMQIKKLFVIDSIGALATALVLSVVLPFFGLYIKTPTYILFALGTIAFFYFLYSLLCSLTSTMHSATFLFGIAVMNTIYMLLTIIVVIYHFNTLTPIDITYFTGELLILAVLVTVEYKTAFNLKNQE